MEDTQNQVDKVEKRTSTLEEKTTSLVVVNQVLEDVTQGLQEESVNHKIRIDELELKAIELADKAEKEQQKLDNFKQQTSTDFGDINNGLRQARNDISRNYFVVKQFKQMVQELVNVLGQPITIGSAKALRVSVGQVAEQGWTVAEMAVFGATRLATITQ